MPAKPTFSASIRLRPRADGTIAHDVRYRHDGRSRTTSFDGATGAERWARILRQVGPDEALKLLRIDMGNLPTVAEYAERYIASKSGVEGKTLDHYRLYLRVSINPVMGELPIDAVLPERIATWINSQVDERYAAKTVKNRHGFLSAMFQSAVNDGLIAKNPCARTRLPSSEQREMVFLSPAEFETLYSCIPEFWRPLVRFLAATGCRFGEATALRPADFDLDARTVRISRAWKSSQAKGWYIGPPKTARSRRTISLPLSLIPLLRPLVDSDREWVFENMHGGPVRQPKFYANTWEPARRLANGKQPFVGADGEEKAAVHDTDWKRPPVMHPIRKWPRVHDLRHTHASWLINDGVPLNVVQRRLGHESITTTVDTYGHLAPDMMFTAADAFDRKLSIAT